MVAFATPCAIELAALRIEVFYPADDITQQTISDWRTLVTE
jgi:hypothetical protein